MKRPVNPTIRRVRVVDRIQAVVEQVKQWAACGDYARAAHYNGAAHALIELLEIDDCGSIGGFDNARGQMAPQTLADRYKWLANLKTVDPVTEALGPAVVWLDANQQEALSGALREIMRERTA